jgi:hypothetical protein
VVAIVVADNGGDGVEANNRHPPTTSQRRSTDIWREKKFCHKNFYLKETIENIPENPLFSMLVNLSSITS